MRATFPPPTLQRSGPPPGPQKSAMGQHGGPIIAQPPPPRAQGSRSPLTPSTPRTVPSPRGPTSTHRPALRHRGPALPTDVPCFVASCTLIRTRARPTGRTGSARMTENFRGWQRWRLWVGLDRDAETRYRAIDRPTLVTHRTARATVQRPTGLRQSGEGSRRPTDPRATAHRVDDRASAPPAVDDRPTNRGPICHESDRPSSPGSKTIGRPTARSVVVDAGTARSVGTARTFRRSLPREGLCHPRKPDPPFCFRARA
jgi:hypothetical protein